MTRVLLQFLQLGNAQSYFLDTAFPFDHDTPPMPLKHFTETFLVVLLGAIIALTGLLVASLPHLPEGALPWVVLFILSIVYPFMLLPMFRLRRADTFFRNLHWFPTLLLLIWLGLEGLRYKGIVQSGSTVFFTWGWTLIGVAIGFLLVVYYCLQVIRRRFPRIAFLALILIPFTALALLSERTGKWDKELASVLWSADFWKLESSTGAIALLPSIGKNNDPDLEPSVDEKEEQWRIKMREQERREDRIAARLKDKKNSDAGASSSLATSASTVAVAKSSAALVALSGTGDEIRNAGTMPGKLPSSGFGWGTILSLLAFGYAAVLHRRAALRA